MNQFLYRGVSPVANPKSASSSTIHVSGQIGIRCFNVNSLFICYAGMAEVKQQLTELRHEIKASKVNQTGGEGREFDKSRVKPTCRK